MCCKHGEEGSVERHNDCFDVSSQRGHRRIVTIANAEKYNDYNMRTAGYRQAMKEHRLQPEFVQFNRDINEVEYLLREQRQTIAQADALFVQWDGVAGVAMQCLMAQGVSIPQRLSILGYNDYPVTLYFRPMLTTMRDAREIQCANAIRHLIALINNPDAPVIHSREPGEIIVRESVCKKLRNGLVGW